MKQEIQKSCRDQKKNSGGKPGIAHAAVLFRNAGKRFPVVCLQRFPLIQTIGYKPAALTDNADEQRKARSQENT